MDIERMEVVGVDVVDLESAKQSFTAIFGVEFVDMELAKAPGIHQFPTESNDPFPPGDDVRIAIDPTGYFELVESSLATTHGEGFRSVHFKVQDLEAAKNELVGRGVRVIAHTRIGGLKEAIFHPDDLHGVRLCLIEYDAPTMVAALQQE